MRYIYIALLSLFSILLVWINVKLHSGNLTAAEKKEDIILQLNFLSEELKNNGLGKEMQELFPEGQVFVNVMYGLAWCELALSDSLHDPALKEKAVAEALFAYGEINSKNAASLFPKYQHPEHGIFYAGWKNYLLSKILLLETPFPGRELYIPLFMDQSDSIVHAMSGAVSPYLQSYPGMAWPADMCVAMASLSNYDKMFAPKYDADIKTWIQKVKTHLDPDSKMIPHRADEKGARGCSMALMLRMLHEVDPALAKQQFSLFKTNFMETTFGLPSIREYPKGKSGWGDVDSGPVIFGVGFSATITAIGTLPLYDPGYWGNDLYRTIDAFGFSYKTADQKKYLFGILPMADVFIAWGRASGLPYSTEHQTEDFGLKFHLLSLLVLLTFWIFLFRKRIMQKVRIKKIKAS